MTTKYAPLRKFLSPLLLLLLTLSACTVGTDTPFSPIDPVLPDEPGNDGNGHDTDSVTVSFSTACVAPYGSQTAATRTGSKVLLSEQVTIEDTWPDSLTARTRAPGYVPTPIARITLTEEPAPAETRASNMVSGKSFFLMGYKIDDQNEYTFAFWCVATVQADNSLSYSMINGTAATSTSLSLSKGKYRFVAHYMPTMEESHYSIYKKVDFAAHEALWGQYALTMPGDKRSKFASGGTSANAPEGHEVYLYDSGETVIEAPKSLSITFKPAFARVHVSIDNMSIASAGKTVTDEYTRIFLAPQLLYNQESVWNPGKQEVICMTYTYPSGGNSSVGQVIPTIRRVANDNALGHCQYDYYFITSPQSNEPFKIPFQTIAATNAAEYVYFPDIETEKNVTLEAGKAYTISIYTYPYARKIRTGNATVDELWWASGTISKQGYEPEYTNIDFPYLVNLGYVKFQDVCTRLDDNTYGTGWRLPTAKEAQALGKGKPVENVTYPSSRYYYCIDTPIPILSFYCKGFMYSSTSDPSNLGNYFFEWDGAPCFPVSDSSTHEPCKIHDLESGEIAISIDNLRQYGLFVKCVKGPRHI